MTSMDFEKAARNRREKQHGPEHLHASGLAMVRRAIDGRHAERLAERMAAWAKEPSIEEQVELDRHKPLNGKNGETRAERDAWLRWNLDYEG